MNVINNTKNLQFEYRKGDHLARLEYRYYKQSIAFMHTIVPDALKGKGIATAMVTTAFQFAKESNKSVMVYCPFVGRFLKKNPQYREQLNKEFHQK